MRILPSTHPDDFAALDTTTLRDRFLVDDLFGPGEVRWVHANDDRLLLGGVDLDHTTEVTLAAPEPLQAQSLCARRELAVVCLAGAPTVTCDGTRHTLEELDVLYVGRGTSSITLSGTARVYMVSAPAHADHPTTVGRHDEVFAAELGDVAGR